MDKSQELRKLLSDLQECQTAADRMKLGMAGVYIAHAIEHVQYLESTRSPTTMLRTVEGGKRDD